MKKAPLLVTLVSLTLGVQGAFFVNVAQAQSAPLVWVSQGVLAASSSSYTSGPNNNFQITTYDIGNGWTASSTAAIVALKIQGALSTTNIRVDINQYSDSGYTTNTDVCTFVSTGTPPDTDGFFEVSSVFQIVGTNGCHVIPSNYVEIILTYKDSSFDPVGTHIKQVYGANINLHPWVVSGVSGFFPMFSIVGNGFSLTPTTTDSGINLSGAQAFCDSQFASSTSFGSGIVNGLCVAGGFLFIPSQNSIEQFSGINDALAAKIPFSYFYDFAGLINNSSASSTANFSVLSVDLRATGVGSTTPWGQVLPSSFTYLASSTVMQYIPQSLYDTLFFLMRSAIWIVVLFHIYHRIRPKHATAV